MKVLHISSGNLYGGVEVLLATLAREQACCPDMEPHFALCFGGRLSQELAALGTPATMLGSVQTRFPWQVWQARKRLVRLLREEAFDVVVCHMTWAHAIFGPVVRRMGLPLALWMHDIARGNFSDWIERWAGNCRPDLTLFISRFTAGTLPNLFPRASTSPSETIYYPVSPPTDTLTARESATVRASFDTPPDACVIIQVSRMEPRKGHAQHLDALALMADMPGWICWFVGGAQRMSEQAYLAGIKERASELGIATRVRFAGERSNVRTLLAAADIFCQPNFGPEPFGIVFVEALYAGLPVVTTRMGAAPEIVDETCGLLVPPSDPRALAEALRQLVANKSERSRLGACCAAKARSLCNPVESLTRLQAALLNLLHTKDRPTAALRSPDLR